MCPPPMSAILCAVVHFTWYMGQPFDQCCSATFPLISGNNLSAWRTSIISWRLCRDHPIRTLGTGHMPRTIAPKDAPRVRGSQWHTAGLMFWTHAFIELMPGKALWQLVKSVPMKMPLLAWMRTAVPTQSLRCVLHPVRYMCVCVTITRYIKSHVYRYCLPLQSSFHCVFFCCCFSFFIW